MPQAVRQLTEKKDLGSSLGAISVVTPPSFQIVTGFVLAILVAFFAFVSFGTLARKVSLAGYVVPDAGVTRVTSNASGVVASVLAKEGAFVDEGQRLFAIRLDRTTESSQLVQQSVMAQIKLREMSLRNDIETQSRLFAQQESGLAKRIETVNAELALLERQVALQEQRVKMSNAVLARSQELAKSNFVSSGALEERQLAHIAVEADLAGIQRAKSGMERELASLKSELAEMPFRKRSQVGQLERSLASTAQEIAEAESRGQLLVTAPVSGKVGALAVTVGQSISANTLMAVIYPAEGNLDVHLFATSKSISFIRPDNRVYLRYDSFPFQKFGHHEGKIRLISSTPVQLTDLPYQVTGVSNEPLFRVVVTLPSNTVLAYGHPQPLRSGTAVDASVALENRRIIEWLFEPLITIKGRLN